MGAFGARVMATRSDYHSAAEMDCVVGDPRGVVNVRLAPRNILDVHRVGEHEFERLLEHVPHRLPVNAGRLHRHMRHVLLREPIAQRHQR
jgi:hypothetical protein